jgi:hypothetical protein
VSDEAIVGSAVDSFSVNRFACIELTNNHRCVNVVRAVTGSVTSSSLATRALQTVDTLVVP